MNRYGAVGLVEVLGEANGILISDQMLKAADVTYITHDTKCGGHALIFIGGSVSAVTAAVDAARENTICKLINAEVVSNPSEEMIRVMEELI